ncbi:helix-turn-helix domain-containing protein [Fontibacillus panacisegetis]|uniref:helix-turn-helix domain-containing protein n=1 Tax=Fontibacillus panacisegetis TaxID=670482 RepID=UPI001FDF62AF|nr:helix-turn-helix transcriptional regulator [Fontibacillus panacisegetis]
MEFGQYLKKLRKNRGLTLSQLAMEAKTSHSYLSQIENGKKQNFPSSEMLINLSGPLGVYYAELLKHAGYLWDEDLDGYNEQLDMERYDREKNMDMDDFDDEEPYWTDLNNLLTKEPHITYRDFLITNEERKLILAYLDGLFAKREGEQLELILPEDRQDT